VIPTYAVIPTRGRDTLDECLVAVGDQVDAVIVVDTEGKFGRHLPGWAAVEYIRDLGPRNISHWWNQGIKRANRLAWQECEATEWNIVVLNDDVIVPSGWVSAMTSALRAGTADLAYVAAWHKITGYAYMLRGESGLRADESLVWWYGDDDLEFQARTAGGVVRVHAPVDHRYPDRDTNADPELLAQTQIDAKTFEAKWSRLP
jgi:glycosyltransferase involved in cell wall biosynthesis